MWYENERVQVSFIKQPQDWLGNWLQGYQIRKMPQIIIHIFHSYINIYDTRMKQK